MQNKFTIIFLMPITFLGRLCTTLYSRLFISHIASNHCNFFHLHSALPCTMLKYVDYCACTPFRKCQELYMHAIPPTLWLIYQYDARWLSNRYHNSMNWSDHSISSTSEWWKRERWGGEAKTIGRLCLSSGLANLLRSQAENAPFPLPSPLKLWRWELGHGTRTYQAPLPEFWPGKLA